MCKIPGSFTFLSVSLGMSSGRNSSRLCLREGISYHLGSAHSVQRQSFLRSCHQRQQDRAGEGEEGYTLSLPSHAASPTAFHPMAPQLHTAQTPIPLYPTNAHSHAQTNPKAKSVAAAQASLLHSVWPGGSKGEEEEHERQTVGDYEGNFRCLKTWLTPQQSEQWMVRGQSCAHPVLLGSLPWQNTLVGTGLHTGHHWAAPQAANPSHPRDTRHWADSASHCHGSSLWPTRAGLQGQHCLAV